MECFAVGAIYISPLPFAVAKPFKWPSNDERIIKRIHFSTLDKQKEQKIVPGSHSAGSFSSTKERGRQTFHCLTFQFKLVYPPTLNLTSKREKETRREALLKTLRGTSMSRVEN